MERKGEIRVSVLVVLSTNYHDVRNSAFLINTGMRKTFFMECNHHVLKNDVNDKNLCLLSKISFRCIPFFYLVYISLTNYWNIQFAKGTKQFLFL